MKIYYCDHCQKRVPEEELEAGTALIDADDKAFCAACVVALNKHKPKRPTTRGNSLPGRAARATPSVHVHPHANPLHTHPPAHTSSEHATQIRRPRSPVPHYALGAAALAALLLVVYVVKSSGAPARPSGGPPPIPPPVTGGSTIKDPTPTVVVTPQPRPTGLFGEMAQEHARETDPEQRKLAAAAKLNDAKAFFKKNAADPWTYRELLRAVPVQTPAGEEAAALIAALKLPNDSAGTPGWFRDWKFENKSNESAAAAAYDLDGKKHVLKTLPPGRDDELRFSRSMTIPIATPFLVLSARASEKGDCLAVVEVNGKMQALETLKGKGWKTIQLNLGKLAGQSAAIHIRHVATGWDNEDAWWTEPKFSATKSAEAAAIEFNPGAPPYSKMWGAVAARAAARPFVGPPEWSEPPGWSHATNLLTLADPKTGALESDWKRVESGALQSSKNKSKTNGARLEIPFTPPPEYSIKATFERKTGNGDAALILPHPASGAQFFFLIGATENKVVALGEVNAKRFDGNPASVSMGKVLENNRRYTTTVDVRKDRISAYLDGRLVTEWTADMGPIKIHDAWKLKNPAQPGIGSWQSEVVFYSVELGERK